MADVERRSEGAIRQADVALRTAGGEAVMLRMPAPAVAGDDAEQLGLSTPGFSDVEIAPALFRKIGDETVLVISASAVEKVTGTLQYDSADVLFATAAGVVVRGAAFAIERWTTAQAGGRSFAYYLTVRRNEVAV